MSLLQTTQSTGRQYGATLMLAAVAGVASTLVLASVPLWLSLSGLVIGFSLWLMQKSSRLFEFRTLTLPGFCYFVYLAIVVIPSLFVYADKREPFRTPFLFAVESALITIPLGILIVKRLLHSEAAETTAFFQAPLQEDNWSPNTASFLALFVFLLMLTAVNFLEIRTMPLLYMISHPGDFVIIDRLREETGKLSTSPLHYLYGIAESVLYPFLIALAFGRMQQTKRWLWRALFCASLVAGVLFVGSSTAKAPVARIFLVLCVYFYILRKGRVGLPFAIAFFTLFFAFPVFVVAEKYHGIVTFDVALQQIARRIFYAPAECLYYYFEVFPRVYPYQYGATIGRLALLLGGQPFDAANVVGRYMSPYVFYTINATAPFPGTLNADFGIAGVLIGGLVAGATMEASHVYVVRRGKTVLTLAMYVLLIRSFMDLSTTALSIVLLSSGTAFVFLLGWAMRGLDFITARALRRTDYRGVPSPAAGIKV